MHEQFRSRSHQLIEQQFIVKVMRKVNDLCAAIEAASERGDKGC